MAGGLHGDSFSGVGNGSGWAAGVAYSPRSALRAAGRDGSSRSIMEIRRAVALASPGDAVLLSPGFSSLDQFASFAVRGDAFAAAAKAVCPA